MKLQLLFPLLIIPLSAPAQITTDGSLGTAQNLPGPNYQIGAEIIFTTPRLNLMFNILTK
jgi:hypothetical protein